MISKPILQPGITHLPIDETGTVFARKIDLEKFKSVCYIAERNYGGKFIRTSREYPDNYQIAWFTHKYVSSQRILVMINIYYPFIGVMVIDGKDYEPLDKDGIPTRYRFGGWSFNIDEWFSEKQLISCFAENYRVLHISELLEPIRFDSQRRKSGKTKGRDVTCILNTNQLRQADIDYLYANKWQVKIVAEAIFGAFD